MRRARTLSVSEFYCLLDSNMRDPDGLQWHLGHNTNALSWPPLSIDDATAGLRVFANGNVFSQPFSANLALFSLGVCSSPRDTVDDDWVFEARDGMSWRFRSVTLVRLLAFDDLFGDLFVHFVASAVAQNPFVLRNIADAKVTRTLVDAAIAKGAHIVPLLPERFRRRSVLLAACLGNLHNMEDIPPELRQDPEFLWDVVQHDWRAMRFMPKEQRTQRLCQAVCPLFPDSLPLIPRRWVTKEMCEGAVFGRGLLLEHVPEQFCDAKLFLLAVQNDGEALQFVPVAERGRELCLAACCQKTRAMAWTPPCFLKDKRFMQQVVASLNFTLHNLQQGLMTDDLLLQAVRKRGDELQFVPLCRRNKKLAQAAVKQSPFALKFVPPELQTVKLVLKAVKREFRAIEAVDNPDVVKAVLKKVNNR